MIEKQAEKRFDRIFSRPIRGWVIFVSLLFLYSAWLLAIRGSSDFSPDIGCRWDCGWYESIATNGYVSPVPPTAQDLNHSNVAFFPLYPGLGSALNAFFGIPIRAALPLVSMLFALGVFVIVGRFVRERSRAAFRPLLLACYPATFYLFVGYSESTYVFALLLGIGLLLVGERVDARLRFTGLVLSGLALGATRLTGFLVPSAVFGVVAFSACIFKIPVRRSRLISSGAWMAASAVGILGFLIYCHLRFGAWDLYFQTLNIGWKKEPSFSGFVRLFAKGLGKSLLGPWFAREPTWMSSMINSDVMVILGYVLVREGRRLLALGRSVIEIDVVRYGVICGMAAHLFVTGYGDSGPEHRWGNGMRYTLPVFFLLVLLWDERWWPEWMRSRPEWIARIRVALLAFGLPFQLYYLYLFTLTQWVS